MPSLPNALFKKIFSASQGSGRAGIGGLYKISAFVLIPLIAITTWIVTTSTITPTKTPGNFFIKQGYLEIVPPSTLNAPGTFNTVEYLGESSVQLHPTCELDELDSKALSKLTMESDTVDSDIREYLSSRFEIKLLEKLKSSLSGEHVQNVKISLRNMKILLLTHQALYELRDKYLKGPCEKAIIHNIETGAKVCQAEAIIQGDMVYTVLYNDSIDGAQQKKLIEEIATDFKAEIQSKNELKGDGLYYGVKLSKKCVVLPNQEQEITTKTSL